MIDVFRIIENQLNSYSADATDNHIEKSKQLEILLQRNTEELRKKYAEWDKLIRGPFLYPVPVAMKLQARFKPPGSDKTVFYGCKLEITALYEHAYHFMQERLHLSLNGNGSRTLFSVGLNNRTELRIHENSNILQIMSPTDYSASHTFINANMKNEIICYPSCRDPNKGDCYAVFNIQLLDKTVKINKAISYIWDSVAGEIYWQDFNLRISKNLFFKSPPVQRKKKQTTKRTKRKRIPSNER